ncbi:hypothetical protein [Mastigocoleus testarum]|uniref:Uncharacterized protein n=1 Tax=Mastigocoleus testarum BC008 TaxID=371196 RepID=A0A0V7ZXY1_9CYAN|nr:hypothetical protein [Mastigocoleus testarum]KST69427.1 hypothetical protein BC008_35490 [Mastigocoleus testarum BC008]
MSKIVYPTLDLFIYNLIEQSGEIEVEINKVYENYWSNLPERLQQKHFSTEINHEDTQRLDFNGQIRYGVDGCYSRIMFDDTTCLRYSCSLEKEVDISQIPSTIKELKDFADLPNANKLTDNLSSGQLSPHGFLGKTWMVSGWTVPDSSQIPTYQTTEDIASRIYKSLIGKQHQHQQKGEFLGATVWEMWSSDTPKTSSLTNRRWEGIDKNSHVMVIFYQDKDTFGEAARRYNAWRSLFYCRHKIIWAYEQGRELKARLAKQLKQNLIDTHNNTTLLKKGLGELKKDLQTNSKILSSYIQDINLLPIQQNTVAVNLDNYEKQRQDDFPTEKFLAEFGQIAKNKYQVQLEKDYLSLNPGLAILENVTSTIRGMVEIEQAQRDRNLNNTVAIAGVGLATSQLASAVIIAQKPPEKCTEKCPPFFLTEAFVLSIAAGLVASFLVWIILTLFRQK